VYLAVVHHGPLLFVSGETWASFGGPVVAGLALLYGFETRRRDLRSGRREREAKQANLIAGSLRATSTGPMDPYGRYAKGPGLQLEMRNASDLPIRAVIGYAKFPDGDIVSFERIPFVDGIGGRSNGRAMSAIHHPRPELAIEPLLSSGSTTMPACAGRNTGLRASMGCVQQDPQWRRQRHRCQAWRPGRAAARMVRIGIAGSAAALRPEAGLGLRPTTPRISSSGS
jgi:hypothetical protein